MALLVAGMMVFSLASCGEKPAEDPVEDPGLTTEPIAGS
mgnify:FL=1